MQFIFSIAPVLEFACNYAIRVEASNKIDFKESASSLERLRDAARIASTKLRALPNLDADEHLKPTKF